MKKVISTIILSFLVFSLFAQENSNFKKEVRQFSKELSKRVSKNEPGVSLIITYGDHIILDSYYGLADIEKKEKLNSNHIFGIASMAKQFTAMAILFLEQEGKLKLEDSITYYFPDLPLQGRKITIQQLLSHTSGLPELTQNNNFMDHLKEPHSINQIIETAFTGPFRSMPGEKFMYCNTGYTIAAALIEKLSGMTYSEYLQKKIFFPLGMNNTFVCDEKLDATKAVNRYLLDSTGYIKARVMHFSNLIGGGSIISNSRDLAKWTMALISGKSLPTNYKKIWNPVLLNSGEYTTPYKYGLGLIISKYNGKTFYWHPGEGDGMNSVDLIFPDQKISINVIQNTSSTKIDSYHIALMAAKYLFHNDMEIIKNGDINNAIAEYKNTRTKDSLDLEISENSLNNLGYELLTAGKINEAIAIFKLNTEFYPQAFNTYDSLGEAYIKAGNKELAIKNYEKSLELNPKNTNAEEQLKKLKEK